jgi:hypothetical protein
VVIAVDLINSSGGVLVTSGGSPINLAVGNSLEIANYSANYTGFARCSFAIGNASGNPVRANLSVFHWAGAYYDTLANTDAR